jgi:hypothetical protein
MIASAAQKNIIRFSTRKTTNKIPTEEEYTPRTST